jgi:hypothetical protein
MRENNYYCDRCGKKVEVTKKGIVPLKYFRWKDERNIETIKELCEDCYETTLIVVKGLLAPLSKEI